MDVLDRWSVDFYEMVGAAPFEAEEELAWFGDIHERAARNGARHGTPILISPTGYSDPRVNLFFRTGSMAAAPVTTMRRYAYSLAVWLTFLHVFGRTWDRATAGDIEAFKDWRITDTRNEERVRGTSFDTDRAALNCFYKWAKPRYGTDNPVLSLPSQSERPSRPSGLLNEDGVPLARNGQDPIRPAATRRRQVKWLLRIGFEQWRNIGLRGFGFDGLRRAGWRGYNEDRDTAFVDGLYGTGLRVQEWASLLDVELPLAEEGRFPRAWLAAACIKGAKEGRGYRIPRRVMASVASYMDEWEGSRAEAIRRAQRAGRYDHLTGVWMVTGYSPRTRELHLEGRSGVSVPTALDVLGPDQRRLLFRRTPNGLQPLAVWLSHDGLPKKVGGWEDTFRDANERIADLWVGLAAEKLTPEQRERRRAECPLWARAHMLRHSFALRWFLVLSLVWQPNVQGFTDEQLMDLRDQFGDVWYALSILMGHAHPDTTRDYYLEPFTGLQVDYLMALLDEDEQAGVDALVRAAAADSALVMRGVEGAR
ncbi:site-specific integrase [Streptomyces sp. NPDC048723]|uniref:site-specific integrase n=1 Tax=Streptomyces sp. NPDC048723 TaxID=3365589 RepID=UPI003719416B